jgi:ribonuclease HIII
MILRIEITPKTFAKIKDIERGMNFKSTAAYLQWALSVADTIAQVYLSGEQITFTEAGQDDREFDVKPPAELLK